MYPPKIADGEVRAVIRALTVGTALPSGAAVRLALSARFGSRGGVARIYRILAEEQIRLTPPPATSSVEALQSELKSLRERLAHTEAREDAHQSRWAAEVDRLRLKVGELEPLALQARITGDTQNLLRHQLQAAEFRAARLEEQLLACAHGGGEGVSAGDAENRSVKGTL